MLIMKFNKMIRNKIVWWFIAGIVIITFVGWFSPKGGCENNTRPAGVAGTLDNKPVTDNELREARFSVYVGLCLSVERIVPITPRLDRELREQAWRRVAALRAAKALNISASPEEVLGMITHDRRFQENGVFSKARYNQFCQGVLEALRSSRSQYEQQTAENVMLQKLHSLVSSAIWVSPDELKTMSARYADGFRLDYVTLDTNTLAPGSIHVTEAQMQEFYNEHTNLFVVPPKVAVRYFALPVSSYLAKAVEKVDTNAIDDYYTAHSDEYMTTDTNGVRNPIPIESVSSVISNRLIHDTALQLARDAANDLADALVPDREGKAQTFEAVAAKSGQTIHQTGLFDAEHELPGIDAGLAFNAAAFRLHPAADENFSDAIAGSNHVYLLALSTNAEAFLPAFETIKDEVRPEAQAKATYEAVEKKARELRTFLETGLSQKKSFAALAQEKALNVHTTALFTASSAPDALSSPEILNDITSRRAGQLTEVLPGPNNLIIAYVAERKPAGEEELSTVKHQVALATLRRRSRILFGDWQQSLLGGGRLVDHHPIEARPESSSDEE